MNKHVLICIGGTLTSVRDPETGQTKPGDTKKLIALAAKAGFDPKLTKTPFIIDSIDFNIGINYPGIKIKYRDYDRLFKAVKETLDEGDTPVICGGTDTKAWYAPLLTSDLMRQGYLKKDSGEKVIFLSSMRTFEKAQKLIEKILRAGKLLAGQVLTGGFALSTEDEEGNKFSVHDVRNHFCKISPTRIDAFRSACPVGTIEHGKFTPDPGYHAPDPLAESGLRNLAHIAPPLVRKYDPKKSSGSQALDEVMRKASSSKAILSYMQAVGEADPPFDGIIIEGLPSNASKTLEPGDYEYLVQITAWLHKQGVRVTFCNPVRFDGSSIAPTDKNPQWDEVPLAVDLKRVGADFVTAQPKDVYIDRLLTTPARDVKKAVPLNLIDEKTGHSLAIPKQELMEIRYVPDVNTMRHSIGSLATITDNMNFWALPNAVIPDSLLSIIKANSFPKIPRSEKEEEDKGKSIGRGFGLDTEYSDLEKPGTHSYAAGQAATEFISSAHVLRMQLAAQLPPPDRMQR